MYQLYEDITKRLGEPLWYDDHGVPRYDEFHPSMLDVYADFAALSEIACQSCGRRFKVGVPWSIAAQTAKNIGLPIGDSEVRKLIKTAKKLGGVLLAAKVENTPEFMAYISEVTGAADTAITAAEWALARCSIPLPDGSHISFGVKWDKNGDNGQPVAMPRLEGLGDFGYGDAPWHRVGGSQCAGTTETTEDVACLQFWKRSMKQADPNFMEWVRVPEFEVRCAD